MNFDARSLLLSLLPIALTLVSYAILRDLLWGIFLGNKSKKTAMRLRAEAQGFQKFSQRYMKAHLTKYQKDYKFWMSIKLVTAISVIVQLIGFILLIFVAKTPFWIVAIICGVFSVANVVLFVAMMNQTATSTNKKTTKGSPWKFEQ